MKRPIPLIAVIGGLIIPGIIAEFLLASDDQAVRPLVPLARPSAQPRAPNNETQLDLQPEPSVAGTLRGATRKTGQIEPVNQTSV